MPESKIKDNSILKWDKQYRKSAHLSRWPWSYLVSYVYRFCHPKPGMRVHELGCGAGANIPFFLSLGADYSACDGSEHALSILRAQYPALASRLVEADFTRDLGTPGPFDLVIDRAALTHNTTLAIRRALDMVLDALHPGGIFCSVDWFSTDCDDFASGITTQDPFVRTGYRDGPFADVGLVHFSDKLHLLELFKHFEIVALNFRCEKSLIPGPEKRLCMWDVIARRPVT